MKALSPLSKNLGKFVRNKKGISLIVSYVLLITIAVSLSILVYNWLRFYVAETQPEACKDGITVVIQDYDCLSGVGGSLNLTLKNKGRFSVDGFVLKVHDRVGADIGLYTLDSAEVLLAPAGVYNHLYSFSNITGNSSAVTTLTLVEVQPFVVESGEKVYCEKVSSQSVECS